MKFELARVQGDESVATFPEYVTDLLRRTLAAGEKQLTKDKEAEAKR